MDRSNRLPPIQQMLGANPNASNAWTAINHLQEGAAPTSPQTQYPAASHLTDFHPKHSHRQSHPHDASRHARHPGPVFAPIDFGRGVVDAAGSARSPRSSFSTAGKPITPERQDSFLLPPSHAAAASCQINSLHSAHSPESQHRNLLQESLIQPLTPPSDPSSTSTQSQRFMAPSPHDRPHDLPSSHAQPEAALPAYPSRRRSHSGPVPPSSTAIAQDPPFEQERSSMPPPPVPAPTMTSPPPPAQIALAISSPESVSSQSSVKHLHDASDVEQGSQERCLRCKETWTYPPMNVDLLPGRPARTLDEMHENTDRMHLFTTNYIADKQADFKRWKQQHCHCHDDRPLGSKRKFEEAAEDESSTAKYRRRSSESPSRLTPPPEQACRAGSPEHEVPPKSIIYKSEYGAPIQISHTTAMLAGITGAPRPAPYERPANDSTNMWHDNGARTRRVNAEETAR